MVGAPPSVAGGSQLSTHESWKTSRDVTDVGGAGTSGEMRFDRVRFKTEIYRERVLHRHGVRARVVSLGANDQLRRRVEDIIDVHPPALGERPTVDTPRHARLRRRGERHLDGDGAASAYHQRLRVQILVSERRRHLDGETSGRAVALHEDRVVAASRLSTRLMVTLV